MATVKVAVIHNSGNAFPGDYTVLDTQSLVYGRIDNESGNRPVPIPLAAPTTAYSWYKALRLIIPAGGTDITSIGNIAIRKDAIEPRGIGLFYRVMPSYVVNNGITGPPVNSSNQPTGYHPADDLGVHNGTSANTPFGYLPVPINPVVISTGSYPTNTTGGIGPIVYVVVGVSDRKNMAQSPGNAVIPNIEFTFDEF